MKKLPHTAIYIHNDVDKKWLINAVCHEGLLDELVDLSSLQGAVYSNIALQYFIDEEVRHDHIEIATSNNTTLANSSSGEQRKALLSHIISKEPLFIVLDNVYESLDVQAREAVLVTLKSISDRVIMIQLLERKRDLLPFIETIYLVEGTRLGKSENRQQFVEENTDASLFSNLGIPPPLHNYEAIQGALVSMKKVTVQFDGRAILRDITWEINAGEFWQLTGPNGSGKSTLLSMIAGDSPKAYGQDMQLFGHQKGSGESVWSIKQKIGYLTPNMIRHFDRRDSIEKMIIAGFFDSVGLYIKPSDMQVKLADDWLKLIGMYEQRKNPFLFLPAGQQRMVLIARAMVKHPPLLILDEPASGLDDGATALFTALVNKIAAETNTAIIYVSHLGEPGLLPQHVFQLTPYTDGSHGQVSKQ